MKLLKTLIASMALIFSVNAYGGTTRGKYFDRAIFVIFENTNYAAAIKQPFFKSLADQGAHFSNFTAITHPSQGNYIALTSGSLNGVRSDKTIDVNAPSVADLLEEKGLTWKVYAEGFPGHCFKGTSSGNYARKHNPFISFVNIQSNPARCKNIVNASEFDADAKNNSLPNYVFYVPDARNDGHDTGVAFANSWYAKWLTPYLTDSKFMENTVIISTFDESGASAKNQIYTSIVGPSVRSTIVAAPITLYSLLNLVEDNWSLRSLNKEDASAPSVPNIWQ